MGNENSASVSTLTRGIPVQNDIQITWKKLNNVCPGRHSHSLCCVGESVYLFGGVVKTKTSVEESSDIFQLDIESGDWKIIPVAGGNKPAPRTACTVSTIGNKIYIFGGMNHVKGWLNDFHIFDLETKRWTSLDNEGGPSDRDKLTSASIGNKIYFFGGFGPKQLDLSLSEAESFANGGDIIDDDDENEEWEEEDAPMAEFGWFNSMFVYDTESCKWSTVLKEEGTPAPRAGHSMCAVDKYLIVFGGRDPYTRQNDIHIFDTDSMKWIFPLIPLGLLPEARSFHSAAVCGRRMMVFGGRNAENIHMNDLHIFDLDTRQWLQPSIVGEHPEPMGMHAITATTKNVIVFGGASNIDPDSQQCTKFHGNTFLIKTEDILNGGAIKPSAGGDVEAQ